MRPHPENWPVHLPSRQLRSATEDQLLAFYNAHQGDRPADRQARDQVMYEMQRRDISAELRNEAEQRRQVRYSASRRDRAAVIENQYVQAEAATNGFMLNRRGLEAHIEPRSLFTGPESRARKYASEELLEYWEHNPRPTQAMFEGADTRIGYSGASIASLGVRRRITTQEQYWRDQYDREQYEAAAAAAPRPPVYQPGPQRGEMTRAQGRVTDRLSRGEAVRNGPGACARPGCYHAKIWHEHANRRRPCERCDCPGFTTDATAAPVPSSAPPRPLLSAEDQADPFAYIERSTA